MGLFNKITGSLSKTKSVFVEKVTGLITGSSAIDEELMEKLEEALIQADVGVNTSVRLVESLRKKFREEKLSSAADLLVLMEKEINRILQQGDHLLNLQEGSLNVILMVGVNGAGKTTSIGKLAYFLKEKGCKVIAAAGDTFRAAAIDQLQVWCQRAGIELIKHQEGGDPAAVVFDALQAAKSRKADVLIVDTAGRLQTKTNLMEELKKIRRIIEREISTGPSEVLLALDATTGQNALSQAKMFTEAAGVTGVVLTKLDGTAKGGVVLGIQDEYGLPVKFVGTGEKIEDLEPFRAEEFGRALLEA